MQVTPYAATKPYVCPQCKGKRCSYCDNNGIKVREVHLISEQPITQLNMQAQQHLKDIKGTIVTQEEEKTKILEESEDV